MTDYIEVDLYLCGIYQGKVRLGRNSMLGALCKGDIEAALGHTAEMVQELNHIPGVQASAKMTHAGTTGAGKLAT